MEISQQIIYRMKKFFRSNKYTRILYNRLFRLKNRGKRKKLQTECISATRAIYDAFEENGLEYAYDFGSLLGLIREKKFMEHDDDIDLMLIPHDYNEIKNLPVLLQRYGLRLDHYYMIENRIVEYTFEFEHTGLTVDVFVKDIIKNLMVSYWFYQEDTKEYLSENAMTVSMVKMPIVDKFKYLDFWGVQLRVPQNAEEVLYWHYGENWAVKDVHYSATNSPGFEETQLLGKKVDCD